MKDGRALRQQGLNLLLLYAAHGREHNNAVDLREHLEHHRPGYG